MTEPKALISEELTKCVELFAREENREPADFVEEALGRYLTSQRLVKLSAKFERRAIVKGIHEEDIPQLVQDMRRENLARNHWGGISDFGSSLTYLVNLSFLAANSDGARCRA